MKVRNNTCWRTDDLKKILMVVARFELDPEKRKQVVVHIDPSRKSAWRTQAPVSGAANLGGNHCWIRLPTTVATLDHATLTKFALVAAHEFAHLRGMSAERAMRSSDRYGYRGDYRRVWSPKIEGLEVRRKEPPRKLRKTMDERIAATQAAIKRWETKQKRVSTYLRKLRRRLVQQQRRRTLSRKENALG